MTLKKSKEIIGSYLKKVKVSPETDPEIQEITREFQKKGYKWLEQKVTYIESSSDFHCSEMLWNYKNQKSCESGLLINH